MTAIYLEMLINNVLKTDKGKTYIFIILKSESFYISEKKILWAKGLDCSMKTYIFFDAPQNKCPGDSL